jgi:hypothetical protein
MGGSLTTLIGSYASQSFWMLTDDVSGLGGERFDGLSCQPDGKIYCALTNQSPGIIGVGAYDLQGTRLFTSYLTGSFPMQERRRKFFVDSSQNMSLAAAARYTNQFDQSVFNLRASEYNKNGALILNNRATGQENESQYQVASVVKDSSNNMYLLYSFFDTVNILKLNSSYSQVWRKTYASGYTFQALDIDLTNGFIYMTGWRNFGEGYSSSCAIKLNLDGDVVWAAKYVTPFSSTPYSIKVSPNGNVYLGGRATVDGQGNPAVIYRVNPSNGTLVWSYYISNSLSGFTDDMAIDSNENVYLTGSYGTNQPTSFVIKLDSGGSVLWQRQMSTEGTHLTSISLDPQNRFFVVGGKSPDNKLFLAKLPIDGSKTGTYTVGGQSIAYLNGSFGASSLGSTASTVTNPTVTNNSSFSYEYAGGSTTPSVTQAKTTL